MKRLLTIILFIFAFISCEKEEPSIGVEEYTCVCTSKGHVDDTTRTFTDERTVTAKNRDEAKGRCKGGSNVVNGYKAKCELK